MRSSRIEVAIVITGVFTFILFQYAFGFSFLELIQQTLLSNFQYFFPISYNILDKIFISLIPVFGLIYYNGRKNKRLSYLISDILVIVAFIFIFLIISLYLLTLIDVHDSPWIPEYIIGLPFRGYYTIFLFLGAMTPVILSRAFKNKTI